MSLRRLLPDRWMRIVAWTATAVVWGTAAVAASASTQGWQTATDTATANTPTTQPSTTTTGAPMPDPTSNGLVVIRFTPVERPAPQVITRTVTRSAPPAAARPVPTVPSSGS